PKDGRITVRLGSDGERATIAVSDTGQGIRPDFLPHVFERFRQGDTVAARLGGLGLGLAIVEHIVEMHGGAIAAESPGEGQGATFTVTLLVLPAPVGSAGALAITNSVILRAKPARTVQSAR